MEQIKNSKVYKKAEYNANNCGKTTEQIRDEKIDEYAKNNPDKLVSTYVTAEDFSEFDIDGKTYITDEFFGIDEV